MKKNIILAILFIMFGVFIGCTKESDKQVVKKDLVNQNPQQVIEDYFKYMNEKNEKKLNSLYYEKISDFHSDNVEEIKLVSIKEDTTNNRTDSYLIYGPGKKQGIKKENIKAYDVTYEVKFKENIGPLTSGIHDTSFIIIRDSEDSPWLIGSQGQ
ncbi:DUF4829 domain-containing protein [Priestia taiwanensis]|uniref:DUF4829 domain-containing protein n=1 Tax=Priestia taiwanensis TaxID=1347902 RepID=A0A917EK34_9BACI|nr:DUF4829 domain-containing protein [Priestia taiwanensis]MBM7361381.1 hypothetical protein [Priestia taiwanensis]GGE53716.1 hypothetical protein GCM10007140_00040 [Priestia taiwanensis]